MRTIPSAIWDAWSAGGPFVGEQAAHGVVTVEIDWMLNTTSGTTVGSFTKGPVRWWQRLDNSQVETVIPNVANIGIQRTLDQDAATCTITLDNQWHHANGTMSFNDVELGQPGYFTFSRGESLEAAARWHQEINDWNNVIFPNALLRTYQGYGGRDKTLEQGLIDGNLVLTGVWLIDTIRIGTSGRIEIQCRDMAKLLIDQMLYPPLVPAHEYPLRYCRWAFRNYTGTAMTIDVGDFLSAEVRVGIESAATDYQGEITEPDFLDYIGNEPGNGYWILLNTGQVVSFGNNPNYGSAPSSLPWDFCTAIRPTPSGKGYYIGRSDGVVFAFGDAVEYGYDQRTFVNIVDLESFNRWLDTTLGDLAVTPDGNGYWILYNSGRIKGFGSVAGYEYYDTNVQTLYPGWLAGNGAFSIAIDKNSGGFWTVTQFGYVQGHHGAPFLGQPYNGSTVENWEYFTEGDRDFVGIVANPQGGGYWVWEGTGEVHAYGSCQYYGDVVSRGIAFPPNEIQEVTNGVLADLVPTPDGNGYWLVGIGGGVFPFGNAKDYGALNRNYNALGREDGNYKDYSEIIKDLLLWSGWYLGDSGGTTDWTSTAYDDSNWTGAKELCKVSAAKTAWAGGGGNQFSSSFPDNTASVLWASSGTLTDAPIGNCYFRQEFFIATAGTYSLHAIADDEAVLYIDGSQVMTIGGPYDPADTVANVSLASGTHLIAIRGTNRIVAQGVNNPAGIAWTLVPYGGGTYVAHSSTSSRVREYLNYTPGSSVRPDVFGNIESTGAWAEECIAEGVFDKKPVIDAINTIKEIVGYVFWIDEDGAAHFESPNIWSEGNFDEYGVHTDFIPDIDERFHITDYGVQMSDAALRSEIIISSSDPTQPLDDTVTTRYVPPTIDILRGMIRPAVWINEVFTNKSEQEIMAELIALYGWLAARQGSLTCSANPAIQINDQIRIWERQTSETYIHYVRGLTSTMDLETGAYTMTLTTNWMGDGGDWAVDSGADLVFEDMMRFTRSPVSFDLASGSTQNLEVMGHRPTDSIDRARDTFWLSPGYMTHNAFQDMEYIQYSVAGLIDVIGIQPWAGNYQVYISIMEDNLWVGNEIIPYTGTVYDTGDNFDAKIPYIMRVGIGWELPQMIQLPNQFRAQKVRLTFSNLQYTNWSPNYRCALREFAAGVKIV